MMGSPKKQDAVKISKKDEADYDKVLDDLSLDSKDVEDNAVLSVEKKKDGDISDKVTRVKDIAVNYRMVLEGRTYIEESGGYKQTGPALAGKHFIALSTGIISSYSEESNLLTQKNMDKFAIQFVDAFEKIENLIMRDRSIAEKDARAIFKLFDKRMKCGDCGFCNYMHAYDTSETFFSIILDLWKSLRLV